MDEKNLEPHVIVLDLETAESADTLASGWKDKEALGLSIGCYWSYPAGCLHWFDKENLADTMTMLIHDEALMVSFNGISFDFPLMCAVVKGCELNHGRPLPSRLMREFAELGRASYDILAEIWKIDPDNKFAAGLNSLNVICQQSGLGPKLSSGAQAPRDWQAGKIATVLNYCQDDVLKTKALFEMICRGEPIIRGDEQPLLLPHPFKA